MCVSYQKTNFDKSFRSGYEIKNTLKNKTFKRYI